MTVFFCLIIIINVSAKVSAVARASDDYMPRDASSQTLHVATVAFNSIFLGEIMVPDWDMFYVS